MVRFNFIISFALAAQGLQAAPSQPRDQLEPLTRDVSQLAQDAVAGYPVQFDKRAEIDAGSNDACKSGVVDDTTKGDDKPQRPIPTGFPSQKEEQEAQKGAQRGKTKHKDAEAQRAKEKAEADAAREANKQAAIDRDAEEKRKEERKKAFEEEVRKNEEKKAKAHQDANDKAQKIVDDGEKNCKEGKNEAACNKPLPTKSQGAAPTQ